VHTPEGPRLLPQNYLQPRITIKEKEFQKNLRAPFRFGILAANIYFAFELSTFRQAAFKSLFAMAHFNTPTSRMAAVTNGVMMILLISSMCAAAAAAAQSPIGSPRQSPTGSPSISPVQGASPPIFVTPTGAPPVHGIAPGPAGATPPSTISTTPVPSPSTRSSSSGTNPSAPSPSSESSSGLAPPPQNHSNAAGLTLPSIATAAIVGVIVYMAAAVV
jgi:hypothetical protein